MPPKMYFLFYLRTQIFLIDSYVLNSKSAAFQSIWLKFGQSDAIYLFYKTVSANFNTPFHFKARAFFTQRVLTNCLPQLHLLIKEKQTHLSKIWDTVFLIVERVEKRMRCQLFSSVYFRREWNMIYRDVYFYTKRSNFEAHLSKSFF